MMKEDLKNRKIANGTYIEDDVLHRLRRELQTLERKVERTKIRIAKRMELLSKDTK